MTYFVFSDKDNSQSAQIYLAAAVLNMPRWLLYTVYNVSGYKRNSPWSTPLVMSIYSSIDLVFGYVFLFIELVLIWVIGIRKTRGLWTTPQPWMDEPLSPMVGKQASSPTDASPSARFPQSNVPLSATSSLRRQQQQQQQPHQQPQQPQPQPPAHLVPPPPTAYPQSGVTAPPGYPQHGVSVPPNYMQHGFVREDISPEQTAQYNWQAHMQYYQQQPYMQYQYHVESPSPPHEVHGDSLPQMGSPIQPHANLSMDSKPQEHSVP
jgi:hypothetical protein